MKDKMIVGIHQVPKSPLKFLLLSLQHVFAMFGANVLVPLLVNNSAGYEVIPIQVAFFCSGIGTIIYLLCSGFKVPIYLGSSFAFLGAMTTMWTTSGYNVFLSLIIVGIIYLLVAAIIHFAKGKEYIKKVLAPIIIGPAIMMIGLSLMGTAASDSFLNPPEDIKNNLGNLWSLLTISILTFITVLVLFVFAKNFLKMIPILFAIFIGVLISLIVWGIAKSLNNNLLADIIFPQDKINNLLNYENWQWYPDITNMWKKSPIANNNWVFSTETFLAIIPLSIITISEHIGDHINIGHLTDNDFVGKKPGLSRTLIGDGLATMFSVSCGGPANTSYGENTSIISMTKVSSVWVIFTAACFSIIISFLAPIAQIISIIPKPVIGGIEIILFSMIAINGLKILINAKTNFSKPKNIIIFALIAVMGLGGVVINFSKEITLAGSGLAIIIAIILNISIPDGDDLKADFIESVNLSPNDVFENIKKYSQKTKDVFLNKKNNKNKKNK
ncbi:MAG: uracil-xanthine permease family protein [Metamycoplasmataceae bacterium]